MITLKRTDSNDPDFSTLIAELDAELRKIYDKLMDVYDSHNVVEDLETVVIAYHDGAAAGCGCFKRFNEDAAEIKRMFVRETSRGHRISNAILAELETWAAEKGFIVMILETGEKNIQALDLYRRAGYTPMPNYGPYVDLPTSYCFRKRL